MNRDPYCPLLANPWVGDVMYWSSLEHGLKEAFLSISFLQRQDDLHRIRLTGGFVE